MMLRKLVLGPKPQLLAVQMTDTSHKLQHHWHLGCCYQYSCAGGRQSMPQSPASGVLNSHPDHLSVWRP